MYADERKPIVGDPVVLVGTLRGAFVRTHAHIAVVVVGFTFVVFVVLLHRERWKVPSVFAKLARGNPLL